jgi:hypothetical protein
LVSVKTDFTGTAACGAKPSFDPMTLSDTPNDRPLATFDHPDERLSTQRVGSLKVQNRRTGVLGNVSNRGLEQEPGTYADQLADEARKLVG